LADFQFQSRTAAHLRQNLKWAAVFYVKQKSYAFFITSTTSCSKGCMEMRVWPSFCSVFRQAVRRLDREQRRQELARLTGGSHVSQTLLDGAEELLAEAEKFRAAL